MGAFLDIGNNVTALLHQSDISWNRISSVTDVLSVGQKIPKIVISKFDEQTQRLFASIKLLTESPFENLGKKFLVGEMYPAVIEKITDLARFALSQILIMYQHRGFCTRVKWIGQIRA